MEELGLRLAHSFDVPGEFRNMQLHPKDTGGSFFEIDEQQGPGAHDPDGPWLPAGPGLGWRDHRRLERVRAITAAEIQADDPDALAARWAGIAELPVEADAAGRPQVTLDNATLRFVPCTDGRPEGLGGIDVATVDRAAVLPPPGSGACPPRRPGAGGGHAGGTGRWWLTSRSCWSR